jgi:hypothetical protein
LWSRRHPPRGGAVSRYAACRLDTGSAAGRCARDSARAAAGRFDGAGAAGTARNLAGGIDDTVMGASCEGIAGGGGNCAVEAECRLAVRVGEGGGRSRTARSGAG